MKSQTPTAKLRATKGCSTLRRSNGIELALCTPGHTLAEPPQQVTVIDQIVDKLSLNPDLKSSSLINRAGFEFPRKNSSETLRSLLPMSSCGSAGPRRPQRRFTKSKRPPFSGVSNQLLTLRSLELGGFKACSQHRPSSSPCSPTSTTSSSKKPSPRRWYGQTTGAISNIPRASPEHSISRFAATSCQLFCRR